MKTFKEGVYFLPMLYKLSCRILYTGGVLGEKTEELTQEEFVDTPNEEMVWDRLREIVELQRFNLETKGFRVVFPLKGFTKYSTV